MGEPLARNGVPWNVAGKKQLLQFFGAEATQRKRGVGCA